MRLPLRLLIASLALPVFVLACPDAKIYEGTQLSGAQYRIYQPGDGCWNGSLVVFAHGYVAPILPLQIPEDHLTINGVSLPGLANQLGYAFALSSFSTNGLAIVEGIEDSRDLVNIFAAQSGKPLKVYIVGVSEGGLIAALSIERYPDVYQAALPACGPIGDFRKQINHIGDFRVIFDYFFPGVIPGSPVAIPPGVIAGWFGTYVPAILTAIQSNPSVTAQFLKVTHIPIGPDAAAIGQAVIGLLWYNVFGTNDAILKLGGQPYDNRFRIYLGSSNDLRLNLQVKRFNADPKALADIAAHYQTTGKLFHPVVTLHTTADPIVPYIHEPIYRLKTLLKGSNQLHTNIPVFRYGHCTFQPGEVLGAFGLMVFKDTGIAPASTSVTGESAEQ